jgi:hypothetical protein
VPCWLTQHGASFALLACLHDGDGEGQAEDAGVGHEARDDAPCMFVCFCVCVREGGEGGRECVGVVREGVCKCVCERVCVDVCEVCE